MADTPKADSARDLALRTIELSDAIPGCDTPEFIAHNRTAAPALARAILAALEVGHTAGCVQNRATGTHGYVKCALCAMNAAIEEDGEQK